MTEVLKVVQDDKGGYVLHLYGREFALLDTPVFESDYQYVQSVYGGRTHVGTPVSVQLKGYKISSPPIKPKKTYARAMGLRKPKGNE